MGPQDTYVVKMEHLVTRARVRGELAPSRGPSRPRFDEGVPSEAAGIPRLEDPA